METSNAYCKNCGDAITGAYCASCGQRTSIDRVTFKDTFQDFVDTVFSVNAPLVRTLKALVKHPGKMFREFLGGKRKYYYKPVAFFILCTILYLVIRSLIRFDPFESITSVQVQDGSEAQTLKLAREFMLGNIDKMLFIFVFTLAGFSKLFFFRKNTLAEFVVIGFYSAGVYTLLTILNMFVIQYVSKEIQFGAMLLAWIYFVIAMVDFYQNKKWLVGIKSALVFFLAIWCYVLLALAMSFLIVSITN